MSYVFSEQGQVETGKIDQITWALCVKLHQEISTEKIVVE